MRLFWFRQYLSVWLFAAAISLLLRANSFWSPHVENDERVYLYLAQQMNWDTTGYTTQENAEFRDFPWSIYRQPLFHQPPFYPLVLKAGGLLLSNPVRAGLWFNNFSVLLLLFYVWRWLVFLRIPPVWGSVALAGVTLCPLLLSSTCMLHIDGLLGVYLACGLIAFIEALDDPSPGKAIVAGVLLTIALNLRYNAIIALPLLPLLVWHQLGRLRSKTNASPSGTAPSPADNRRLWTAILIVAGLVLTVGGQHYYRILANYGTLDPGSFVRPDPDAARFNAYVRMILGMERWRMALLLGLIFPILSAFFMPATWTALRSGLRERDWGPVFLLSFVYLLLVQLAVSFNQIRFFAAVMPCLYLGLPWLMMRLSGGNLSLVIGLCALSALMMTTTGFAKTQTRDPGTVDVVPAPIYYLPPLRPLYPQVQ